MINKSLPVAIPNEVIMNKIYYIRGKNVMLDQDLAELYDVETKRLNEQVKRNLSRFPDDFMFKLNKEEFKNLKSQFATSSWGGRRKIPFVFGWSLINWVLTADYGKGFDKRNLVYMRQFYLTFQKMNALRSQLSWTHYRILLA